jgi:hypothetical protein
MNIVGDTGPRLGCVQRRSASTPVRRPLAVSTICWYETRSSPRPGAPGSARREPGVVAGDVQLAQAADVTARPMAALGAVHGKISVMDERLGFRIAAAVAGDADTAVNVQLDVCQRERAGESGVKSDRDRVGLGRIIEIFAEYDELVAGQTGQAVTWSQYRSQALPHSHQQLVTDLVSIGVVDGFERVEIYEEHRDGVARALCAKRCVL